MPNMNMLEYEDFEAKIKLEQLEEYNNDTKKRNEEYQGAEEAQQGTYNIVKTENEEINQGPDNLLQGSLNTKTGINKHKARSMIQIKHDYSFEEMDIEDTQLIPYQRGNAVAATAMDDINMEHIYERYSKKLKFSDEIKQEPLEEQIINFDVQNKTKDTENNTAKEKAHRDDTVTNIKSKHNYIPKCSKTNNSKTKSSKTKSSKTKSSNTKCSKTKVFKTKCSKTKVKTKCSKTKGNQSRKENIQKKPNTVKQCKNTDRILEIKQTNFLRELSNYSDIEDYYDVVNSGSEEETDSEIEMPAVWKKYWWWRGD